MTLIELAVVLFLAGILVIATGFSYAGWIRNYRIEMEARGLYTDLMHARTVAMEHNIRHFIVLGANSYEVIEDTDENGSRSTGDLTLPLFPKPLIHSLNWNGAGNTIKCDERGLLSPQKTIWFSIPEESGTGSDYDCIVVSRTRLNLGQFNGSDCQAK